MLMSQQPHRSNYGTKGKTVMKNAITDSKMSVGNNGWGQYTYPRGGKTIDETNGSLLEERE